MAFYSWIYKISKNSKILFSYCHLLCILLLAPSGVFFCRFDRTEERGEARVKEAVRGTAHGSPTLWYYSGIFQKFLGC